MLEIDSFFSIKFNLVTQAHCFLCDSIKFKSALSPSYSFKVVSLLFAVMIMIDTNNCFKLPVGGCPLPYREIIFHWDLNFVISLVSNSINFNSVYYYIF